MNILIKALLFPFSLIYGAITALRNHLYTIGYKHSFKFQTQVISVGNLNVGGSGKTPTVEYLIRLLKDDYRLATLSRGYGRKSRGFRLASGEDDFRSIGDEPFQYFTKFGDEVTVAVGEDRALAIPEILYHREDTQVILLDDAYQHRSVVPSVNILLTAFQRPFYNDVLLPAGRLRESREGANRAGIILVTKCPISISEAEMKAMTESIRKYSAEDCSVFFTRIRYGQPLSMHTHQPGEGMEGNIMGFSGIANHRLFESHLRDNYEVASYRTFGDHHEYTIKEVRELIEASEGKPMMTTEKDMVKLMHPDFKEILASTQLFYIPIIHEFVRNGTQFDDLIINSIKLK